MALPTLLLYGCADESLPTGVKKLTVWGLQMGEELKGLDAKIAEFERRNPKVKVSVLSMGAGQMNPQKLMTAIVGNVPPDVIYQDRFTIGDWASRDTFQSLDAYIKRDRDEPMGVRQEDYFKPCWAEAQYKGSTFAVPATTDDRALYWNKAIFRKAGLDPEKPPRTWEELRDLTTKLTRYNVRDGSYETVGFIPNYGNSFLYIYSWANGGEFMSADGRTCTMNSKENVDALQFMVDMYGLVGGIDKIAAFTSGFQTNDLDPFLTGKVAMKIDGNWVLNNIARFGPDLDFGVAPAPVPAERLEQTLGGKKGRFTGQAPFITWSGGFSYALPVGSKNPDIGWEFIKWMQSPEAGLIESRAQKAFNVTKERPYVPNMSANIRVNDAVFKEFGPTLEKYSKPLEMFLGMMPQARFRPVTFVGQRLWDEHIRAFDQATHLVKTPLEAMDAGTRVAQVELDKVLNRKGSTDLNPAVPYVFAAVCLAALLGFVISRIIAVRRMGRITRQETLAGYAFAAPWMIGFVALTAGPIVTSMFLSLCDYDVLHSPKFLGFSNYQELLGVDIYYLKTSLLNVLYLAMIGIPLGICTGLSIAMLLNSKVGGMSAYRTCFYLPSIVPVVASAVLWAWVLNGDPNRGLLNALWKSSLQEWFGIGPPAWFAAAEWAKPGLIVQGLWGAGGGMILWLAGLQGIPQHLYEAAEMDGANWLHKFRAVTIPMLSPYIFFNLIMGTIQTLQEFDRIYVLAGQGAGGISVGPVDSMLVPVMYLFNNAFKYFKMGYASALAWVLFLIILALTVIQLKLAPRWVHYEAEKG